MTRRDFAALAAAPSAAGNKTLPVSIFSKHLHWLSIPEAAAFAKECGYDAIDLTVRKNGHIEPENAAIELPRAAEAIRKAGIEISMITTAITGVETPHSISILDAMKAAGVRHYRWGGLLYDKQPVKQQIAALRPIAKRLADESAKRGCCGIYHTHSGAGQFGASFWDIFAVVDGLDPKALAINFDIGHATVEGGLGGWINSTRLCASNIGGIAYKDFVWTKTPKGWQPQWCPLGEGMVKLTEFSRMIRQTPFDGPIQLHFEYPMGGADHGDRKIAWSREQVATAIRRDLERLRSILAV